MNTKLISFKTFKKYCGHKNDLRELDSGIFCSLVQDYGKTANCTSAECPVWKRLRNVNESKQSGKCFKGGKCKPSEKPSGYCTTCPEMNLSHE